MTALQNTPIDAALDHMGARGAHRHRRYQLPWIMLVGESGSGRTSLVAGARLRRPYGAPTQREMEADGWGVWLFDQGAVLDMPGMTEIPNERWHSILGSLRRARGQRPIDGMVLTIPATELTGPQALKEAELERKSQTIAKGLRALNAELGVRVPICVVITKSDILPGFSDYCHTLPESMREDMLGWSSPYKPQEPYASSWVEEAFTDIHQALCATQVELFADGRGDLAERESSFLFPGELRALAEPLRQLLDGIFTASPYSEPALLRGIYLCGDPDVMEVTPSRRGAKRETRTPAFVTQLLERKAFPESGLAAPKAQALRQNRRVLTWLRGALAICLLLAVGVLGLLLAFPPTVPTSIDAHTNQTLAQGQLLLSPNGRYSLEVQGDGNLVLFELQPTRLVHWATHIHKQEPVRTVMQADGNLVVYDTSTHALWASGSNGRGGRILELRDDGRLVILDDKKQEIWSSSPPTRQTVL